MPEQQINDVAKATLLQFNSAMKKIETRELQIADLKKIVADTLHAAVTHSDSKMQIKELEKENQADRDFIKQSIDFYEDITGQAVGTGELFNQQ